MTLAGNEDVGTLAALVEGAADGLLLISPLGFIVRANDAAAQLVGVPKESLRGCRLDDVLARTNWEPNFIGQVLAASGIVSRACDLRRGRKAMVSARTAKVGERTFVVATLHDVTGLGLLVSNIDGSAPATRPRWSEVRTAGGGEDEAGRIVAESAALRAVNAKALDFAAVDSPVLIVGETGTGKNLVARMIHRASSRAAGPLREVNCGAIPAGLIESELFGYARGAFTGADGRGKVGLVELAHTGTLLLDEIGDLPHQLQVKLLTFLEAGQIWPVGAAKPKRVDVRVIAATNANIPEMVADGRFRQDLYYRLNVLVIHVPPLRERPEDIPALVDMMLRTLHARLGKRVRLSADALALLSRYPFPGNVRELWNLVERFVVCAKADVVDVPDIPIEVAEAALAAGAANGASLKEIVKKVEAGIVREALSRYGTQSKAAKHLRVGQATIARKARLYDLGEKLNGRSNSE